jgi:hypothetical protein
MQTYLSDKMPIKSLLEKGCFQAVFLHNIFDKHFLTKVSFSVADPGCLSRFPVPYFFPCRIPDLTNKRAGKSKLIVVPFG